MSSSGPMVCLCMIVQNGTPYVVEALGSVRAQTYRNIELIVHDCCSTDGTLEHVREFAASVSFPVRLVSEKDGDVADSMNRAWVRYNGSVTALIDVDNMLLSEHIQTGVEFFARNPDITFDYQPTYADDVRRRIPDVSKIKNIFGWEAKIKVDESLEMCIN